MNIRSLAELKPAELIDGKKYTASPAAWEGEVLYFLLADRSSDNNEKGFRDLQGNTVTSGTTALFSAH